MPRLPEVGGDDVGVRADRRRVALGDEPAVVEDLDPIAQVHHQRDVVGDQDDRDPELVAQPADQAPAGPASRSGSCRRSARRAAGPWAGCRPRARSPADAGRRTAGCGPRGRAASARPNSSSSSTARLVELRLGPPEGRARQERRRAVDGFDRRWSATLTLSSTDSSPNSRMFWKVRPTPSRATLKARRAGDVAALEARSTRSSAA